MHKRTFVAALVALLPVHSRVHAQNGIVVIGHAGLEKIDVGTVQRIYTGRVVAISGVSVNPVNATSGSPVRSRFLTAYLNQDEDRYVAYWTVRRYIGKGVPPKELASTADVIAYVQTTPGAIGYIDETSLSPGMNVLLR